ncbi:hypothetical protein [Thermus albus]|uniref:hypothetical protein n=1 Tax=Thermus albus TaxID=2908146 RepID=UPI001FAA7A3C|nr:hypothetical protein [Thermus albus]
MGRRHEELLQEAERERLLKPLRFPWRLKLGRLLLGWGQRLAPGLAAEPPEVSYGG